MRLRKLEISGDGEDTVLTLGMQSGTGEQVSYQYPGRMHVKLTAHETGFLNLVITVNPMTLKQELTEKNVPQARFDK